TTKKGETRTQTLVLTDNPRVVEMTQAYMTALRSFIGPEKMGQLMQQLPAEDRGLLRAGTDYRLASISGAAPSAALFELPAEPSSLADMLQDMIQRGTRQGYAGRLIGRNGHGEIRHRPETGDACPRISGAAATPSLLTVANGRRELQRGVPGEVNPGVLRYLRDKGIDELAPHGLGV